MMDLDGFKLVNDTYGHATGDDVLRTVFNQMARGVRNTDFLARYGGDELTLILSQTEMSSAQIVSDITAYLATLIPGQTLYLAQLAAIAIKDGAQNAVVTAPAADVVPTGYQMIRAGTINVT